MSSTTVLGLDVGTTKIAAVIAKRAETGPQVVGFGSAPAEGLRRGVVVDIEKTADAIAHAVHKAEAAAGLEVRSAVVGITGGHITSLNNKAQVTISRPTGQVAQEDVDRVQRNATAIGLPPDYEIVNTIPRWYVVDGQPGVANPVGMFARRLEVEMHIVIGMRSFAKNLARCVERVGLEVEDILLEPVATARAVLSPDEMTLGVVLLDIGGGTTDIAIYSQGSICFTGAVPMGGLYVTRDLAAGMRATLAEAERVKLEYGRCLASNADEEREIAYLPLGGNGHRTISEKMVAQIIEARMEEILVLVRRELSRSPFYKLVSGGVVLTGGGCLVRDSPELAARILDGLNVRIGIPTQPPLLPDELKHPAFATSLGLVLMSAAVEEPPAARLVAFPRRIWDFLRRSVQRLLHGPAYD